MMGKIWKVLFGFLAVPYTAFGSNNPENWTNAPALHGMTSMGDVDGLEKSNMLTDSCDYLSYLESKNSLTETELDEANFLDEIVGKACHEPVEYLASSRSHRIQ